MIQKATREQIENAYLKYEGSFTKAGNELGLTKQRVEQIVKKTDRHEVISLYTAKRRGKKPIACVQCNRSFRAPDVKHVGHGMCSPCYQYARRTVTKRTRTRKVAMPKYCLICDRLLTIEMKRIQGLCYSCYKNQ